MLKSIKTRTFLIIAVLTLLFSCANRKKIVYFQGDKSISTDTANNFALVLKTDDLISVMVMGMDGESVKPFNLSTYGQFNGTQLNVSSTQSGILGYLIDANGEIEFPVIGKIKIAGLNRVEASELIKSKLKDYVKQAMVHILILNFKFTILGDVNKPGTYAIPNERLTLIEAIGLAGDLNASGMRKNVMVIRDKDGKKTETRVDLTSKDVFNSPVFYLQQNDVIYVEQNRAKKNSAVVNLSSVSVFVSLTSLLITLATLLSR